MQRYLPSSGSGLVGHQCGVASLTMIGVKQIRLPSGGSNSILTLASICCDTNSEIKQPQPPLGWPQQEFALFATTLIVAPSCLAKVIVLFNLTELLCAKPCLASRQLETAREVSFNTVRCQIIYLYANPPRSQFATFRIGGPLTQNCTKFSAGLERSSQRSPHCHLTIAIVVSSIVSACFAELGQLESFRW